MIGTGPADERRHLAAVEEDLVKAFPALSPEQVHARWSAIVQEFSSAPIRDFVPVLARKRAIAELRQASSPT